MKFSRMLSTHNCCIAWSPMLCCDTCLLPVLDNIGTVSKRQSDRCRPGSGGSSVEDFSATGSYSFEKERRVWHR